MPTDDQVTLQSSRGTERRVRTEGVGYVSSCRLHWTCNHPGDTRLGASESVSREVCLRAEDAGGAISWAGVLRMNLEDGVL